MRARVRLAAWSARSGDTSLAHDALRACRLFAGLDEPTLGIVAAALRRAAFDAARRSSTSDDPGDALFIVASGQVKITIPPGDGSEPAILTTIGPGGFFGELALLDGAARSATAVAVDAVETQVLRRDAFDRLVDEQPALRRALLRRPGDRDPPPDGPVRGPPLPGPARAAGPPPAARRCPAATTAASWRRPPPADGELRLPWPYTQGELAGMIGGSRQSVNRLLADFVAQGLLRFEGDDLVIPDAAGWPLLRAGDRAPSGRRRRCWRLAAVARRLDAAAADHPRRR